jgi:hypothetical protein
MGIRDWVCAAYSAGRWVVLACVAALCMAGGGCLGSNLPAIQIPANAKLLWESRHPLTDRSTPPPDSSGKYYVYDENEGEATNVFFLAPDTPVNLNCLPGGHRYQVYYAPREAGLATAATRPAPAEHGIGTAEVLRQARKVAEKLRWLDLGCVIYDREYFRFGPEDAAENHALLEQLAGMTYTMDDALPLLKDADPKVRTLGMIMVFYKEGAPAANAIASLMDDEGETFPKPISFAVSVVSSQIRQPYALEKQKVRELARGIVERHLTMAGWFGRPWQEYWALRRSRPYGAADFVVALDRASGSISPVRPERLPAIHKVGEDVRKLPMPDRFFILHRLWWHMEGRFPDTRETAIVSRDELVALARELPVETRWAMVHDRAATDDPDQPLYMQREIYRDARKIVRSID